MTPDNESSPNPDVPEAGRQGEPPGPSPEESGRPVRPGSRRGWVKRVCVAVFGVMALGVALKLTYPLLPTHLDLFGRPHKRDLSVRAEDYEPMSPFFIPMPSGRDKVAARVDIRVKWDRLTGARFKRDAVLIRERVYVYLREVEQWSEDMEANRQVLEEGIGRILRQALGVKDVDVLVEDIYYVRTEALALQTRVALRDKIDRTSSAKGVCSWIHAPMSATPCRGSRPPTRWWA